MSSKKVTSKLANISKNIKDLNGKIVLIENADPGYDYIFNQKIIGLITKYGGINSHMTIRCSELGIPAAIGIGENLYDKICLKKYYNRLSNQKNLLMKIGIITTFREPYKKQIELSCDIRLIKFLYYIFGKKLKLYFLMRLQI